MDFAPAEATLALQGLARDFARQEIAQHSDALDGEKDPENRFPRKSWKKATPWACAPSPSRSAWAAGAPICSAFASWRRRSAGGIWE